MISIKIVAVMEMAAILESREKEISMPEGSQVGDLLLELEKRYGEPITKIFYGSNRDLSQVLMLNGRNIYFLKGMKTELKDGDQIFIIPLVAGG